MADCDGCSMCCKLLAIDDPLLEKPLNQWCKHCTKPGCAIYDHRPSPCIEYSCVYLQSQSEELPLPLSLRPDNCKVVIDITKDGVFAICRVDPIYPKAINGPEVQIAIKALAKQHTVIMAVGLKKQILYVNERGRKVLREMDIKDDQTVWYD